MKQEVKIGQTDYSVFILIRDTSGNAKTGLAWNDAGSDISYARMETDNDATVTACVLATLASLAAAHSDWGFLEVDATNHPGLYRLDIADGVFASGAWSAVVSFIGTGIEPSHLEFVMAPSSPYVGVQLDPTQATITFTAVSITGQLDAGSVLVDAGMDIVGALSTNSLLIDTTTTLTGNVSCAGTFDVVGAVTAGSVSIDAGFDVIGALSANSLLIDTTTTLSGAVSLGATLGVTGVTTFTGAVNANITGDITGDLSGSVGSLTGHTVQTGDNFARIGTPVGASISADVAAISLVIPDAAGVAPTANEVRDAILDDATRFSGANIDAAISGCNTVVPPSLAQFNARTIVSADYVVAGDAMTLTAAAVDLIADEEYDNDGVAISHRESIRLILSVLTAESFGGGTATVGFRDVADSKNRISATVDANGNRTAIGTRDGT